MQVFVKSNYPLFVIVVVKNMEKYIESIPSIEQVCSVLQIAIKVDDG